MGAPIVLDFYCENCGSLNKLASGTVPRINEDRMTKSTEFNGFIFQCTECCDLRTFFWDIEKRNYVQTHICSSKCYVCLEHSISECNLSREDCSPEIMC